MTLVSNQLPHLNNGSSGKQFASFEIPRHDSDRAVTLKGRRLDPLVVQFVGRGLIEKGSGFKDGNFPSEGDCNLANISRGIETGNLDVSMKDAWNDLDPRKVRSEDDDVTSGSICCEGHTFNRSSGEAIVSRVNRSSENLMAIHCLVLTV